MLCRSHFDCMLCSSFQQTCKFCRSEICCGCTLQAPPIKKPSPPVSANPSPVAAATASLQSVAAAAAAAAPGLIGAAAAADLEAKIATRQPSPAAPKASPVPPEAVEVDYRWAPVIKHYSTVSATCTQLRCPSSPVHYVSPAGAVHKAV